MSRASAHRQVAEIGVGLALVLLVPRLVRLFYPEVWIEDDFYLENAFLVSIGMRPYVDFLHVHFPVLEWIAGAYIKLFGASLLSLEFLNEAAIYLTSLLVFALAQRVASRQVAIASAILYGFASLVFRYHVYERECFIAPLLVAATMFAIEDEGTGWRPLAAIAALLAAACAIKLTAVVPVIVIVAYWAIAKRQIARAIAIGAAVAGLVAILTAFCYWRYGYEFIFQTFLFHFMKGRDGAEAIAVYPALILDILAPLFILGAVRLLPSVRAEGAAGLVLTMAVAEYVFFGLLSPTAWGHNYLEALPFIAIVAGVGAIALVAAVRRLVTAESPQRRDWWWAAGGGLLVLLCLLIFTPLVNENWLHGSVYGFGFIPRDEISQIAAVVSRATAPGENVIAPSFICFEANRPELIRYPELYGAYREAKAIYERNGFQAARAQLGGANFFTLIEETAHYWNDPIKDAVAKRQVKIVISDSPIQLLPLVLVPPQLLADSGYQTVLRTQHYAVWELESAPVKSGP